MNEADKSAPAGLLRRLAAAVYDGLLIIALMAVGSLPMVALNDGEAISPGNIVYQIALVGISLLFYTAFWLHGGQTPGMRVWRLHLVSVDGKALSGRQVLLRYCAAWISLLACGLGFLWILVDNKNRAWHDQWSGSQVIVTPRLSKKPAPSAPG